MTKDISIEHSAMAVVFCGERILATQEEVYGKLRFSLPKGHIESNETVVQAAIRECFEETNVIVANSDVVSILEPFEISFTTPNGINVSKKITPVLFRTLQNGRPMPKEKRIFKVEYMPIDEFLNVCSYDNVKQVVQSALKYCFK